MFPSVVVGEFERVKSADAARSLGISLDEARWGEELRRRMNALGWEGPATIGFGGQGNAHRGYQRPKRITPEEFLQQFTDRDDAVGAMARAALQAPSDLSAVAVGAMARLADR